MELVQTKANRHRTFLVLCCAFFPQWSGNGLVVCLFTKPNMYAWLTNYLVLLHRACPEAHRNQLTRRHHSYQPHPPSLE
jgi:hypothetical protein